VDRNIAELGNKKSGNTYHHHTNVQYIAEIFWRS